jgi:hypothetical protein
MIHPISFSIPLAKVIENVQPKCKVVARVIPGTHKDHEARKTHVFKDEQLYYEDYQRAIFGLTCKKGGWDCLRHYEILANGCIPVFGYLEECPTNSLTQFPKALTIEGTRLYHTLNERKFEELTVIELRKCNNLARQLLEYTQRHLTTAASAQRMLNALDGQCDSVLFLSGSTSPDYLRCLTLHGLKSVLGRNCHDYPCVQHLYDKSQKVRGLYGHGFTYTRILDPCYRDDKRDLTVEADIVRHRYDKVVYGSYHRGMPLLELVMKHYAPENVVLMCGEDLNGRKRRGCSKGDHESWVARGHHVFVREL